jgi:2'-5' RNA ligase
VTHAAVRGSFHPRCRRRVGQPQDSHKFAPHVTLARLRHPEPEKVMEWLSYHALYTSAEFTVAAFALYSSKLTSDGSVYRLEQEYPLEGALGDEYGEIDD